MVHTKLKTNAKSYTVVALNVIFCFIQIAILRRSVPKAILELLLHMKNWVSVGVFVMFLYNKECR